MNEDNNQITEIVDFFREIVAKETSTTIEEVNVEDSFFELGLDSINAIFVLEKLEIRFNINLPPILFWDYPTIKSFSNYILSAISDA